MQMLYNSEKFSVLVFDPAAPAEPGVPKIATPGRGGFEIVDKFARKEIFIQGVMADGFQQGVEALMKNGRSQGPTEEEVDAFIGRYSSLMQHPVVLH